MEAEDQGMTLKGYEVSFVADENILNGSSGDGCTTLYIHYKPLNGILQRHAFYGL